MADNCTEQALIGWAGDIASLITEMKRRARARTDTELAEALGINQSTVSTWRRRGSVPEAVLLRFQEMVFERSRKSVWRFLAARAIAIRVASYMDEESGSGSDGSWTSYMMVSMAFGSLVDAIYADLEELPGLNEVATFEVANRYLRDREYLARFAAKVRDLPIDVALKNEARALRLGPLHAGPQ